MTLVRVNGTDSGGEFSILNLQMITRADCRKFDRGQDKHHATVFFSDGGSMALTGADRTISALEDFAGYPRL